jgi:ParB-like chromosome segregation protein Spo0J
LTSNRVEHQLAIEYVPIANLDTYPGNARLGDVDAIADSMDENGVFDAIVVQRSTGYVLDGNHRYLAMQQMGEEQAPVIYVDVDDDRARRIVLVANRTNDLATYDNEALIALLNELPDLTGTGFDDDALAALIALNADDTDWDDEDLQDTLDDADKAGWPVLRLQIDPTSKEKFDEIPGEDDVARFYYLLEQAA